MMGVCNNITEELIVLTHPKRYEIVESSNI